MNPFEDLKLLYILDGREPVHCPDTIAWAEWMEQARAKELTRVAETSVGPVLDSTLVSTIFLGVNHSFGEPPILFETMVFGGPLDGEIQRCGTWDEAAAQHEAVVAQACAALREEEPA